jgi:hypothetical protein
MIHYACSHRIYGTTALLVSSPFGSTLHNPKIKIYPNRRRPPALPPELYSRLHQMQSSLGTNMDKYTCSISENDAIKSGVGALHWLFENRDQEN